MQAQTHTDTAATVAADCLFDTPAPPAGEGPFQVDVKTRQDQLAAYVNAKYTVSSYVAALLNADISGVTFGEWPKDVPKPPIDPKTALENLRTHLSSARGHGMNWSNNIEPDLTKIPQGIINFNSQFQSAIGTLQTLAQYFIDTPQKPSDPAKAKTWTDNKSEMSSIFGALLATIGSESAKVQGEIDLIKGFNTNIHADARSFSTSNKNFETLMEYDKENLKILDDHLKAVESAISTLNKEITATGIGVGASIAIIGIGAGLIYSGGPVKPIIGAIVMVIGFIGVGMSVAFLIQAINDKAQEEQDESHTKVEITLLTQQLTAVKSIENVLGGLASKSEAAAKATQIILDTWTTLEVKIAAVKTDLDNAQDNVGNILSKIDLTTAGTQWNQLQDFATKMQAMHIEVNNDPHPVAVSHVQVQKAA